MQTARYSGAQDRQVFKGHYELLRTICIQLETWRGCSAPPYGALLTATNFPEYTSCTGITGYVLICGVDIRTEALR
jgi:hypothetical protein